MIKKSIISALSLGALSSMSIALAQSEAGYEFGPGALQRFSSSAGVAATPLWIQIWLGILTVTFLSSVFFVRKYRIARWAIGGILLSVPLTPIIVRAFGWPFLCGAIALGHLLFWTPALYLLLKHVPFSNPRHPPMYRFWAASMTGVILFSFVFDIRDAGIYLYHIASGGLV